MSGSGSRSLSVCRCLVLGALGLLLLLMICYLVTRLIQVIAEEGDEGFDQVARQRRQAVMAQQVREIREGNIDCLVNPDPFFLDELLADPGCRENLTTIYMGRDVSDPRLSRLRDLPNLRSIIFFWSENPEIFLERMREKVSIEALCFDRTQVSRKGIEQIATLPNLKSLGFRLHGIDPDDLESLRDHPSIESLVLTDAALDDRLIPVLKSLPQLRSITIQTHGFAYNMDEFEKLLRQALPGCRCSVQRGSSGDTILNYLASSFFGPGSAGTARRERRRRNAPARDALASLRGN